MLTPAATHILHTHLTAARPDSPTLLEFRFHCRCSSHSCPLLPPTPPAAPWLPAAAPSRSGPLQQEHVALVVSPHTPGARRRRLRVQVGDVQVALGVEDGQQQVQVGLEDLLELGRGLREEGRK